MKRQLLQQVLESPRLPSLPAVAVRVIDQCRRNDTDIRHIADTITSDPSLSTKILNTVNSAYYGRTEPVATITQALVILGLNSVKTLVLGFTLVHDFQGVGGRRFDMGGIWRRALYAAVGARAIAGRAGLAEDEEAFLAGLLQDLGVIAMIATLGEPYIRILSEAGGHGELAALERERLGIDHTLIGEAVAHHYAIPPQLVVPIRHHERPEGAPDAVRPLVHAVEVGGCAADLFLRSPARAPGVGGAGAPADDPPGAGAAEDARATERFFALADSRFGIDRAGAAELLHEIGRDAREMAALFDISTGPARDPSEILATANELLLRLSLETQQNAHQLERQNRRLRKEATTDPLTGAANRGRFSEFLRRQFRQAAEQRRPLTLVLLDADDFKRLNDMHGHLAGDRALVALAQALREHAPRRALVARYGGEEFALVIPRLERRDAAFLAEGLRRAIEAMDIPEHEPPLRITASFGVATDDGSGFFSSPEQLINAADQAVYAAKAAGRNAVRIFAPRPPQPTPA